MDRLTVLLGDQPTYTVRIDGFCENRIYLQHPLPPNTPVRIDRAAELLLGEIDCCESAGDHVVARLKIQHRLRSPATAGYFERGKSATVPELKEAKEHGRERLHEGSVCRVDDPLPDVPILSASKVG